MVIERSHAYTALFLVAITSGVWVSHPTVAPVPVKARPAPLKAERLVTAKPAVTSDKPLPPPLADLQQRTFRYFWNTADPNTGLVPDRYPTPSFSSIAAVGFALTAYPIGVERGYV